MKQRFLLVLSALLTTALALAGPVSKEEAKSKAAEFMSSHYAASRGTASTAEPRLVLDRGDYFVFNMGTDDGFVIVCGDDRAPAIPAYSDRGTFDNDDARKYWKAETRYTIMGGETCAVSNYCLCDQTLQDLQDYHWTYLHDGYNQDVLNRWRTDGCFREIEQNLGYRLVLRDVHYEDVQAGKPCKVTLRFDNKGYAAPMNPREAWLVWVGSDGKTVKSLLGYDPRTWHSGYNCVVSSFTPSTDKGKLYLELSDPLLPGRADFSIALANVQVFDAKTGYNLLFEVK